MPRPHIAQRRSEPSPGQEPQREASSIAAALAAAAVGVAWFLASGAGPGISPSHVGWVLRVGDPIAHWLGWAFFRNEPWRLPLGAVPGLVEPLGTSVALTDAIPLVAVLARPFSPVLPADFQYQGLWLLLCFALQGFFGARVGAALRGDRGVQFFTGVLFALSPPLLRRVGHEALAAHWLLLGLIALAIRRTDDASSARRTLVAAAGFAMIAATVHPTLALQTLGLAAAVGVSLVLQRQVDGARFVFWLGAVVAIDGALFGVLGYFGTPLSAGGYGFFAADLLTFVNPMGWSRLLPTWPTRTAGQAEGFAYLGAGGIALVAVAVASRPWQRNGVPWRRIAPLLVVVGAFGVFAISTYVTFGGRKLFGTSSLPRSVAVIVAPFRASGRFVWPLYYTSLAMGVGAVLPLFKNAWRGAAPALLAAAVALQVVDIGTGRVRSHFAFDDVPSMAGWELARGGYRHLAIIPPRIRNADGQGCGGVFGNREIALAYRAYRLGLGLNSGYVSRLDVPRTIAACNAAMDELSRGTLRADTLYVPDTATMPLFAAAGATCGRITSEIVCVARDSAGPLKSRLSASAH